MNTQHIGSNFDDFLREENLLDVAEATADKRVMAFQIAQERKRREDDQVRDGESEKTSLVETTA